MQGVILIISSLPFLIGFVLPVVLLIIFSLGRFENADGLFSAATRSIVLASATAIIVVGIGLFLAFLTRINTPGWLNKSIQTASLGYAIPGTVLGLGVLIVLSQFDNFSSQLLNLSFLPILSGSLFALIFAYSLRFLSISFGTFEAELSRIPKTTDMAASTLGARTFQLLRLVHLPMLRPALITASVLIFVDTMKELPATLILRPFNFETLATQVYNYASVGQIEDAALPALIIVGVGIIPVFVATRKLHKL
jgi:iron(III) transport system permease protein|tara:strand:- start:198 stop:953 length:756 start_codon:yes stop_codon:yes gene_type:complete